MCRLRNKETLSKFFQIVHFFTISISISISILNIILKSTSFGQ